MIKIKRRKKRKEKVFYHVEVKRNIKNAKNWKTLLGSVRKSKSRAKPITIMIRVNADIAP